MAGLALVGCESVDLAPSLEPYAAAPWHDADGDALPTCPPGFTGRMCNYPCDEGITACSFEYYRHGDARIYGIGVARTHLFPLDPQSTPLDVASAVETWISTHEDELELPDGLDPSVLQIEPSDNALVREGLLTTFRLRQYYPASDAAPHVPVTADGALLTIESDRTGCLAIKGTIVDPRAPFANAEIQAEPRLAEESMLKYVADRSEIDSSNLKVTGLQLVAVPSANRIGWYGIVSAGMDSIARVTVDADPDEDSLLDLLIYSTDEREGLDDEIAITVRSRDLAVSPWEDAPVPAQDYTHLSSGEEIRGSIVDGSGDVQLGNPKTLEYDLLGGTFQISSPTDYARIIDPTGEFLASPGASQFDAQQAFHLTSELRSTMDRLTWGTWDSAVHLCYPDRSSDFTPGTYEPRVLLGANHAPTDASGVADFICIPEDQDGILDGEPLTVALSIIPDAVQRPYLNKQHETILVTKGVSDSVTTVLHEAGHLWDTVLAPGSPVHYLSCAGVLDTECTEGTTDEAYPLTETIAQMFALLHFRETFPGLPHLDCLALTGELGVLSNLSRSIPSTIARVQAAGCMVAGDEINLFVRPDDPACLDPFALPTLCDRPDDVLTEFSKFNLPCVCDFKGGYNTMSVLQAWWNMLNGVYCEPTSPFDCSPATPVWPPMCNEPGSMVACASPTETAGLALVYAVRTNPLTYNDFFDAMARFIACNYGEDAYNLFNQALCDHLVRDCAEPAPVSCQECSNGIREGDEVCDDNDLSIPELGYSATCESLGYPGGELFCDANCEYDVSHCSSEGLDSTAGSEGGGDDSTEGGATGTGATTGGSPPGEGQGGCQCTTVSAGDPRGRIALMALVLGLVGRRRARPPGARSGVAMVAFATAMLLAGCHCPGVDDTSEADSAMSSSTMTSSSSGSELETGASSEAGVEGWPTAWHGDYHQPGEILGQPLLEPTIGYGLPNILTFDDTGIRLHGFNCAGGPAESVTYEVVLHDDSLELVQPPIEGAPLPPLLGHDELIVRPGIACGELSVEDASGERLAQWTLGQLCLTNSCDEIPSDDHYEQDLCPDAVTECRR